MISLSGVDLPPDHRKIEPMALATDDPPVVAVQRKLAGAIGRPDLDAPVFLHMQSDDPELPARLSGLGGTGRRITSRLYTARIPRDASRYISNWPQVAYIESAKRARPLLDLSRPAVFADDVHLGTGLPAPFNAGITGAGIYVGAVDSGLSGTHPDFAPSRVVHTYGLNPLVDAEGHGTHVMGIAAGNGSASGGTYTGMAPGAQILFGKTTFLTTDIISAVQDLVTFAETNSRPIPVNLSLGLMVGPHDGSSGFESGINSLAEGSPGSRRIISVAAGNETGDNEHFQATIPPFGSNTITVIPDNNASSITVHVWAEGEDQFTAAGTMGSDTVTVPSGSQGTSPQGRISISNRRGGADPRNGDTFISVTFLPLAGGGTATIQLTRTGNGGSGIVDAYIDSTEGAFNAATDAGTITEPGNGTAVIAVGSFDTKTIAGAPAPENLSGFSSLGPTRDGRLKPDITAPGFIIYSARSAEAPASNYAGIVDNNYAILAGTSMAAPHVAGIAALVWQSNSALTGAQMRERIRWTASLPTDGSPRPNTSWGYGKADALAAVRNSVASITAPATIATGSPVTLTSENSSGAFGNPITTYTWSLSARPPGSGATLSTPTSASSGFTPDVPGDYTVGLTVSQATPAATPAGTATAVIHANNIPVVTSITGPVSSDNQAPVSFQGAATDADGQAISFHWVLVSRPAGSIATLSTANVDNVTLSPDVAGTYEVGLRVNDGTDSSTLAVHAFAAGGASTASPSSGGGGGGCSVANRKSPPDPSGSAGTILSLLLPAFLLAVRRFLPAGFRATRTSSRIPPPGRKDAL
jgi:subtilisin family serine protease